MAIDALANIAAALESLGVPLERGADLGSLTWYGVGGRAAVLAHPQSPDQLADVVRTAHQQRVPLRVLGKGANLLVPEGIVAGIVVTLDATVFRSIECNADKAEVIAGGGADFEKVITTSVRHGLAGLEGLAGIPATVGGAVRMNAGGAFGEVGPTIARLTVVEPDGTLATLIRDDLDFAYRRSNVGERIVIEAEFQLTRADDPVGLREKLKQTMKYKKHSQPMAYRSAGCAFKNPRSQSDKGAGWLIDQTGLKGLRVGGAQVSDVHANFILLESDGQAADVLAVMQRVQEAVKLKFSIDLEREVVVWQD